MKIEREREGGAVFNLCFVQEVLTGGQCSGILESIPGDKSLQKWIDGRGLESMLEQEC